MRVAVKFKQQRKIHHVGVVRTLHQHAVRVLALLQDVRAEPFGNERDFQIAGITVVGRGAEIHNAVRVEGIGAALRVKRNAHRAGNRLGRIVGEIAVIVLGEPGGVYVLTVIE